MATKPKAPISFPEAWAEYKKLPAYKVLTNASTLKPGHDVYLGNRLYDAFTAGWNARGRIK